MLTTSITARCRARTGPPGMTLIELLMSLVMLGLVGVTITTVMLRQQRFHAAASAMRDVRESTREVAAILPADLRGVSPVGGDLYELGTSSLRFRAQTGSAIICTISGTRTSVTIPPLTLASEAGLTAWVSAPVAGDSVFIFDEGATEGTEDDSWRRYRLTANPAAGVCPTSTRFTATATEADAGYTLTLSGALPTSTPVGSVIRFFRTAEYRLYAESGAWYLGYRECPDGACQNFQPVSGPFPGPLSSRGAGLQFTFLDSLGAVTAVPSQVSRLQFIARAETRSPIFTSGSQSDHGQDSLVITVAFRNRK